MQSVATFRALPQKEQLPFHHDFLPTRKIFVGCLPGEATVAEIKEVFKDYEPITEVRVKPNNYAFVEFKSPESVERIMKRKKFFQIRGRTLNIDRMEEKESARRGSGGYLGKRGRVNGGGGMMGGKGKGGARAGGKNRQC